MHIVNVHYILFLYIWQVVGLTEQQTGKARIFLKPDAWEAGGLEAHLSPAGCWSALPVIGNVLKGAVEDSRSMGREAETGYWWPVRRVSGGCVLLTGAEFFIPVGVW